MEAWEAALSQSMFDDYVVKKTDVPAYESESALRFANLCKENLCGRYGTNWGCPPGFSEDVPAMISEHSFALMVRRTFCLDVKDREVVEAASSEMQRIVRLMVAELRSNGLECRGFTDGGCKYCGECSYPDPCRFPEVKTASVSALGIDLKSYLESIGESFSFSDDCMTLYGIILVK